MTFSTTALSIIGFASVNQHNNTVLRVIIYLSESYRHSDDRELIPDLLKPPAEPEILRRVSHPSPIANQA